MHVQEETISTAQLLGCGEHGFSTFSTLQEVARTVHPPQLDMWVLTKSVTFFGTVLQGLLPATWAVRNAVARTLTYLRPRLDSAQKSLCTGTHDTEYRGSHRAPGGCIVKDSMARSVLAYWFEMVEQQKHWAGLFVHGNYKQHLHTSAQFWSADLMLSAGEIASHWRIPASP
jgi:hypothetical protein